MNEVGRQRATLPQGPEARAVSNRSATRFSQWLNTKVTGLLTALGDKVMVSAPLEHRGQKLGTLSLTKKKDNKFLVEVSLGEVSIRFVGERKNYNFQAIKGRGFAPVKAQVARPELGEIIARWCEIDRGAAEGLN